jgi:hypothetical protein
MSAFDYPRLMLTGTATCSPATGNNCRFVPLSIFDPVSGVSVIPPRLFLLPRLKKINEILKECKDKGFVPTDETIEGKKYAYVEIAPDVLNDPQNFKDWALLPLGSYSGDEKYHDLYKLCGIAGKRPGYFNYYGKMEFDFRSVEVKSIALHVTDDGERIINEKDAPKDLVKLFNLELKINDGLTTKAKMVDSASSVSMATQIFWDKLTLAKSSKVVFSGKPCKASLRFANASRVYNTPPGTAHCASGTFFSAIPIEDIENGYDSELLKFFNAYKIRNEELIGLQLVFNLFEVKEFVDFEFDPKKPTANNVETKVIVAITPWYKGDLKSISLGRQLNAGINYLKKCVEGKNEKIKDFFLSPVVAHVDYEQQYVMLDLINNIPELYQPGDPSELPNYPIPNRDGDNQFQTIDIGMLKCRLYESQIELGRISINPTELSRMRYLETSGKKVFYLDEKFKSLDFKNTFLGDRVALYLFDSTGRHNLIREEDEKDDYVMLESEFMIATDQGSLCVGKHDEPAKGYRCFSGQKENCQIRIYRKGIEYLEPIPITIIQCEVTHWNLSIELSNYRTNHYKNGDIVSFPTEKEFNGLYLLYANIDAPTVEKLTKEVYIGPYKGWLWYYLMTYFNSYIAVRVLPRQDYSKYLDLHDLKREVVTFEVLKKEIFDNYDLLYPAMSRIFPFDEKAMRSYQDHIYQLMSFDNWHKSSYMPVSRDLSPQQLRLFWEWMSAGKGAYHHGHEMIVGSLDAEGIVPR